MLWLGLVILISLKSVSSFKDSQPFCRLSNALLSKNFFSLTSQWELTHLLPLPSGDDVVTPLLYNNRHERIVIEFAGTESGFELKRVSGTNKCNIGDVFSTANPSGEIGTVYTIGYGTFILENCPITKILALFTIIVGKSDNILVLHGCYQRKMSPSEYRNYYTGAIFQKVDSDVRVTEIEEAIEIMKMGNLSVNDLIKWHGADEYNEQFCVVYQKCGGLQQWRRENNLVASYTRSVILTGFLVGFVNGLIWYIYETIN